MRFAVPQFIDIEDKIIGPFTWKQFIYLAGGVGFAGVLFLTAPFFVFMLAGIPIAGLASALAFYRVNSQPFAHFLESMASYFSNAKLYLWEQKENSGVYHGQPGVDAASDSLAAYNPHKGNLHSLSRELELKSIQTE